jgi:glycosyltransferase involved in cell wall biosynthesis
MGNQNMRHTALALAEAGALAEAWTCLSFDPHSLLASLLPKRWRAQAERRAFPPAVRRRLRSHPWREAARLACQRVGWQRPLTHEHGWCSIDAVCHDLDRRVAGRLRHLDGLTGVYAYEDAAETTFATAGSLGLQRIYDLPIGYWRAFADICREEEQREPAWAGTLVGNRDSAGKFARKDGELANADHVVVASSFTRATLSRYPGRLPPVSVVPYGAPPAFAGARAWSTSGPLRVLYVGSLSQRKGISYLLAGLAQAGKAAELTIIGSRVAPCAPLDEALGRLRYLPSLPHAGILEEMRRHDVLVFPSLFEGFGLVITEAMSQGMVVITTAHTAGPDLIRDGHDGFLVPIRDADAISERLRSLAHDRDRLRSVGLAALATAATRTWEDFRLRLCTTLGLTSHSGASC